MGASTSKPSHGASEAAGPLTKRLHSPPSEHDWAGNRIEDVSNSDVPDSAVWNDDGPMQLANEELQCLMFSCQPTGAASDDPSGSARNVQLMSHRASKAAGPLRKQLISAPPEHDWSGNRIKDVNDGDVPDSAVSDDDGQMQLANEDLQSLLFSCQPMGAISVDPSGSAHNVQQMSSFKLDGAKHKIFLSHAGAQKDFVEQLCVDLERQGYFFPFFDQRHHSLPKGKDFAPLIMEAARLCHVAVIVLSEEFLSSKWPMVELAAFYSAQQEGVGGHKLLMLPLFFKLSVKDVKDEDRWMPIWKQHASKDQRIDVTKWSAAVKALCKANGERIVKDDMKVVAYRKHVVESIFRLSPPDLLYGSCESMVGYDRMCKGIWSEFVKNTELGADVLGIYGMAGLGKTTLSKAMCDYFYGEFSGKVCHVELGKVSRAWRQERILKMLCGFERSVMDHIGLDVEKGLTQMKRYMSREPVLLVIDNVTSDVHLQREARDYLTLGFHPKSKIIIMSTSKAILEDILPSMEFFMSMPKLCGEEAGAIFLKCAAPMKSILELTHEEQKIVEICTRKCWFESEEGGAYHPLALTSLADFFSWLGRPKYNQMLVWKDHLDKEMVSGNDVFRSSKGLFEVLNLQFGTFDYMEKLMFLDITLFLNINSAGDDRSRYDFMVEWLSRLHDETPGVIKLIMQDFEKSGMIILGRFEDYGPIDYISVPDLYTKFAMWYVTKPNVKGLRNAWGVFQTMGTNSRGDASSSSRSWASLVRLRIEDITPSNVRLLLGKGMQEMSNLVVLLLDHCSNITVLNLKGLDCLRDLELNKLTDLVTILLPGSSSTDEYTGIHDSLQDVVLMNLFNLCDLPDFRPCTSLHSFTLDNCYNLTNLGVLECPQLKELNISRLRFGQYDYDQEYKFEGLPNFESLHSLVRLCVSTATRSDDFSTLWQQELDAEYMGDDEIDQVKHGYCGELFHKLNSMCLQRWKYMSCSSWDF